MEKVRDSEPLTICFRLLKVPASSYYYHLKHPQIEIADQLKYRGLKVKITRIIRQHNSYGYRRIKAALGNQGIIINAKPLKKLLKSWNLQCLRRIRKFKPSPLAKHIKDLGAKANLAATIVNPLPLEIILTDFTQIISRDNAFWLILYADQASKKIIGWNISPNIDTENALRAYARAKRYLKKMKVDLNKVIIHQDQGTVFTGYEYAGTLLSDGIKLSYTEKGFKDNPLMETCNGHFKDEYGHLLKEARDFKELLKVVAHSVKDWNQQRIHSTLKGQNPDDFIHSYFEILKG